jgi:hypothetical protein
MTWSVRADAWGTLEPLRERVVNCLECVRARVAPFSAKYQHGTNNNHAKSIVVITGIFFYRSGASATGCRHEVVLGERYLDLRQNPVLGE